MDKARKHLFVVHSGFSLVMVLSIIHHHSLPSSHVKILTLRKARSFAKIFRDKGFSHRHLSLPPPDQKLKSDPSKRRIIQRIDRSVRKMCGWTPIKVYTFDAVTSLNQVLITFPTTQSFALYEEGSLHRKPAGHLLEDQFTPAEQQELYVAGQAGRFFASGVINEKVRDFYSFSSEAFQGVPVTNVKNLEIPRSLAGSQKMGPVLALGGYHSDFEANRRMHQAARWLSKHHFERICLKAHPATSLRLEKRWLSFLRSEGLRVDVLSESTILEAELVAGNIDLLAAWGSSALAVAHDLNIKVHNFLLDNYDV